MKKCKESACDAEAKHKNLCKYHYHKDYRLKNKTRILSKKREWIKNNKEKISQHQKKYTSSNPEIDRNKDRKRRALKKQNGFEKYTEKDVLLKYGLVCYLCGKDIDFSAPRQAGKQGWQNGLHIDHVLEISLGGPDTLENVRPTHALCNLRKKPIQMV